MLAANYKGNCPNSLDCTATCKYISEILLFEYKGLSRTRCPSPIEYSVDTRHAARCTDQSRGTSSTSRWSIELSKSPALVAARHSAPTHHPRRQRARRRPDGFVLVAELAAAGAPRSTVYDHIRTGKLAAHLWRGRLLVDE